MNPRLSVLMAVFNEEEFLPRCIDSILNQTFQDFELVVIDDNSTDGSGDIILTYTDRRIKYFKNNQNLGLAKCLNIGLKKCSGQFLARIDADDYALPHRFERQVEFLTRYPEVCLVGSSYLVENDKNELDIRRQVTGYCRLKSKLFFGNNICHPSIMVNLSMIKKGDFRYEETFRYGQDYDLWVRLLLKGYVLDNIKDPLIVYSKQVPGSNPVKATITNLNFQRSLEYYIRNSFSLPTDMEVNRLFFFFKRPEELSIPMVLSIFLKISYLVFFMDKIDRLDFILRGANQLRKKLKYETKKIFV